MAGTPHNARHLFLRAEGLKAYTARTAAGQAQQKQRIQNTTHEQKHIDALSPNDNVHVASWRHVWCIGLQLRVRCAFCAPVKRGPGDVPQDTRKYGVDRVNETVDGH